MPFLLVDSGPESGKRYPLQQDQIILGRHPDCAIVVDVGAVSRQHAQILREGEVYYLEDLKSRNGTFLNGSAVSGRQPLKAGDQFRVCDVAFSFLTDKAPQATEAFPPANPDGSSSIAVMVDDEAQSTSTIMSKLDVSTARGGVQLTASPEAKLSALLEITQSLGRALGLDDVLPQVLNSLFKIFVQADRGFIVLKTDDGNLIPRWTKNRRDDDDTIRISRTIVHEVINSKEAILSADAASDSRFELSQSLADFRIRSMMCAPLVDSEGNAIGVLQVDTLDQRKRFDQEDLEVLVSVAVQAGIAIDNAQLHEAALNRQALERDLELAHEVQRSFLPDRRPEPAGYQFFDYYRPANHVGGDYYDYIPLPDGRLAIIVADVVGHGVAAALMMAKLSAETRFSLAAEASPAKAVTRLNDRISDLQVDRFVTLVLLVLDPQTHEVTIVNAGHMAPIHHRADGQIDEPSEEEADLPVGITDGVEYEQVTLQLQPGESLTMYTDGINEAMNVEDECYGMDRIREHVKRSSNDVEATGNSLVEDVHHFIGSGTQDDDMCIVSVARLQ